MILAPKNYKLSRAGFCLLILIGAILPVACTGGADDGPSAGRINLPRQTLQIAERQLEVEVASTPESLARGLMYRKSLGADEGMLFVLGRPQRASFWMKNTRIPLSIAYLDSEMTIVEIHDLKPYDERSTVSRSNRIAYALEVNRGWFQKHGIEPGTPVTQVK
jgi:uncharacterized membrane protein (UPF0127 family)